MTEHFLRPGFIAAQSLKVSHVQIWMPPDAVLTLGGQNYKRVARVHRIEVSRSTGYHIVKHGASPGALAGNPYAGDGDENRGLSPFDDMPQVFPPRDPSDWWYSFARIRVGNYSSYQPGGQYTYADGVGQTYQAVFDPPLEIGPNSGLIVRNVNQNQGINATFFWSEAWVPVPGA